jgi:phosphatidylglycerol lysyltransferase
MNALVHACVEVDMIWLIGMGTVAAGLALWTVISAWCAEREFPPSGAFIEVDGTRLHYVRRGSGPPVVALHGSEGSLLDFAETVLETLSREFEVVAFDRPGHGYSDGPSHAVATPEVQMRLLHAAICRLGLTRPLLVGHSWSSLVVLMAALEFPDEAAGLVLLAPWVAPPASPPSPLLYAPRIPLLGELSLWTVHRLVKGAIIRYYLRQAFLPDPVPQEYARQSVACWLRWPRQVKVFSRENTADRPAMRDYSPRYGRITVPVVIVAGEADRVVPTAEHAEWLHRVLPNSELVLLPNTGHQLLHTRPEFVCAAVQRCAEEARRRGLLSEASATLSEGSDCHSSLQRVRELVLRYGWNATSYQILNPAMEHWFSGDGDAVVGYVRRGRYRVVAGAPVCAQERLAAVVAEFEASATEASEKVCYFGAASRLRAVLQALPGHAELVIGAQPVWNPQQWPALLKKHSSLRAQINRARNKGVRVEEGGAEQEEGRAALQACLSEWLATRPFPTLRFLTEPVDLGEMRDRRLFVAYSGDAVVGFLIATPVPDRNGWLIEQIVRGRAAPNGMAELLVGTAMQALAEGGAEYVTLGLSPLSQRTGTETETEESWLRLLLTWVRAHGKRFYNFDGLDAFKAKFRPDSWEPLYAISNERHFSLPALYAIAAAFSEGRPVVAMLRAVRDAARQEFTWYRHRHDSEPTKP